MNDILEDFSLSSLLPAMEANVHAAWIRLGRMLGAEIHDEAQLLWFFSGRPFNLANGIMHARFPSNNAKETFEEKLKQLTAPRVPLAWLVGPSTHPTDLGNNLQERGWMRDDAPGMAIDLQSLSEQSALPSNLSIERVDDGETLKTWLRVMTVGSELPAEILSLLLDITAERDFKAVPDVHCYLGRLNGEPVATSLLFLGGGVAGIYNVATLPEARRQGIGSALTVVPLLEARKQGYRIGTLQSTSMGLNLYRRLGFREYCLFSAYSWSPPEAS
ncbi:MAG TPA: GNAT family N-acetyltransferase [Ktedonosporobacter sp.]|jgi:GNAT superfamily N-acetyltransferase|nr:GNAT family N-acetyltransferase [Ktedonosporobacter sp.]